MVSRSFLGRRGAIFAIAIFSFTARMQRSLHSAAVARALLAPLSYVSPAASVVGAAAVVPSPITSLRLSPASLFTLAAPAARIRPLMHGRQSPAPPEQV